MPAYTLVDTNIHFEGCSDLTRKKVNEILSKAIRRKMRLEGFDAAFRRQLSETGYARLTWHFTRYNHAGEAHWVTIEAQQHADDMFTVACIGPASEYTLDRINKAFSGPKRTKQKRSVQNLHRARNRKQAARNKRQKKLRSVQIEMGQKKTRPSPAPFSTRTKDRVVWQFQNNVVTWKEAVSATVYIFNTRGNWKSSANQLAARELFRSFDNSGHRFMRMKRGDFEVRFDILQTGEGLEWNLGPEHDLFFDILPHKRNREHLWERFEQTRFTVSCTKNNTDPLYRRVRSHFKTILIGLPPTKARERRILLSEYIAA